MHGIPAKEIRLAHSIKLNALDIALSLVHYHYMAAEATKIFAWVRCTPILSDSVSSRLILVGAVVNVVIILRICFGSLNDNGSRKKTDFTLIVQVGNVRIP